MALTEEQEKKAKLLKSIVKQQMKEIEEKPDEVWRPTEKTLSYYTSMDYWYPKVQQVKEIRTPETIRVPVPDGCDLFRLLDFGTKIYKEPLHYHEFIDSLRQAASKIGVPCFLRSGQTSDKHDWIHSCYVQDIEKIYENLCCIVNLSGMADLHVDVFYVRKLIPTKPIFTFFEGMPITREFRFKLEGNEITHVQPYWLDKAFEDSEPGAYTSDMRDSLREISILSTHEFFELKDLTLKLRNVLPDFDWSVDWLQDKNGNWWLTDMARAEHSYWWQPDFKVVEG